MSGVTWFSRAMAVMALGMLGACATSPSARPPESKDVRAGLREAPSKSADGLPLVCSSAKGQCYMQQPLLAGSACECAHADGTISGKAGAAPSGAVTLASVVEVYFATDRERTGSVGAIGRFGAGRSARMNYGMVQVSIPATHQTGFLESPSDVIRIQFLENPTKHVLLLKSTTLGKVDFLRQLKAKIAKSDKKEAFLFVHGFNTTFEQAALRSAQMSFDLGFRGAPVFYSWPSKGSSLPLGYMADSQTIEWAKSNLRNFVEEFLTTTDAQNVYLIGHSMGTRALTDTVASLLNARPELRAKVREIILAAPDIDADIFKRDIAPAMVRTGRPVTLYASSEDVALKLSHMANSFPRAGDSQAGLVLVNGIETIDASNVSVGFLGHSVFAEAREVLSDWRFIIDQGLRASQRTGLRQVKTSQPYWVFKK